MLWKEHLKTIMQMSSYRFWTNFKSDIGSLQFRLPSSSAGTLAANVHFTIFRRCYFGSSNKLVSLLTRNLESEHLHNSIEATQLCWCLSTCKLYGICRLSNSPPLPGTIGFLEAMLFISFLFFGPSWKKKLNEGKRSWLILTAVTWPWQLLFRLPVNGSECPTSSTFYVTGSLFTEAKQTTLRSQLLLSDSLVFGKVANSRPSHQI